MNKQIKLGSMIVYVNIFLNLVINFMLTPILLKYLGESEYGVYKIVQSFTGQLAIMSFGISTVVTRYVVVYNTTRQKKEKENFLFMANGISVFLAAAVFVIGMLLYFLMDSIYGNSLSTGEMKIAKNLCIFLVVNVALSILCDAYIGLVRAHERFVVSNGISTFRLVFRLAAILVSLKLGFRSLGIVIIDLYITLLTLGFSYLYTRLKLKEKSKFNHWDKHLLREIAVFALAVFFQAIVNQVNQNLDNTILGIMSGATVVTVYSMALTLYSCFISLVTALSSMFAPQAIKLVASGATGEELTNFTVKPGRIQTMIALLGIMGFTFVGKDLIHIWIGSAYDDVYKITLILIIPAVIPLIESVTNTILDAMMKRMARSLALIGMCVINIISSVVFIEIFGYIGAAFGTALSVIVGNGIVINLYLYKKIGLNIPRMFKEIFEGILPAFGVSLMLGCVVLLLPADSLVWFIVKALLLVAIYTSAMLSIGMNTAEKSMVQGMVRKVIHHRGQE